MDQQRARHAGDPIGELSNRQGLRALLHCGLVARGSNEGGGTTDDSVIPIPSSTDDLWVTGGRALRRNVLHPGNPALRVSTASGAHPLEPSWFDD